MRIAVQMPSFLFNDPGRDFTGYARSFFLKYRPYLYYPSWKNRVTGARGFKRLLEQKIGDDQFECIFSLSELNAKADVLINFDPFLYKKENIPCKGFNGLKIWHVMEYVFRAEQVCASLQDAGVQWVMGYTDHGKYCPFFQKYYAPYVGKIFSVPFGFGDRFVNQKPFSERINKVVGLGFVNPVNDPLAEEHDLTEYIEFYKDQVWTHAWRRALAEQAESLGSILDHFFPMPPFTKNLEYDAVQAVNDYTMFANDEGLMAFPPARTYEGCAAGSVMVANDHPSYRDLGFEDGLNCILHPQNDLNIFKEKISHYIAHPDQLEVIAKAGCEMVRRRYNHGAVAGSIFINIKHIYEEGQLLNTSTRGDLCLQL